MTRGGDIAYCPTCKQDTVTNGTWTCNWCEQKVPRPEPVPQRVIDSVQHASLCASLAWEGARA